MTAPRTPCIKQINRALARAGVGERLTRCRAGYYYLIAAPSGPMIECSIYSYRLDPEDFDYAAGEINDAFARAGLPPPLELRSQQ